MGHYLSEMESPDEASTRMSKAQATAALQQRGYFSPQVHGHRNEFGEVKALHHLPCGLAVFDPETHDPLCPAQET